MQKKSKKIIFLDRDGVINKKAKEHSYIVTTEDFVFNSGIFEVVLYFRAKGFEIIVITNQRGISRGLMTKDDLENIHQYMRSEFEKRNISILDIFYCPHGIDECKCRKPRNGMLRMACAKYAIDIDNSILISDTEDDVIMGIAFGLTSYKIHANHPESVMIKIL